MLIKSKQRAMMKAAGFTIFLFLKERRQGILRGGDRAKCHLLGRLGHLVLFELAV